MLVRSNLYTLRPVYCVWSALGLYVFDCISPAALLAALRGLSLEKCTKPSSSFVRKEMCTLNSRPSLLYIIILLREPNELLSPRNVSHLDLPTKSYICHQNFSSEHSVCWRTRWKCFSMNIMSADQSSPFSVKIGFVFCQNNPELTGSQQSYLMAGGDFWWHLMSWTSQMQFGANVDNFKMKSLVLKVKERERIAYKY